MKVNIKSIIEDIKNNSDGEKAKDNIIITISDTPGSGGVEIVEALAKKLDLEVFDKDILSHFSDHTGTDEDVFKLITEDDGSAGGFWLQRLFGREGMDYKLIRRHLNNVMYALARSGNCVIVGRGGHIPLSDISTLRIRVTGSETRCIERIMKYHNMDRKGATEEYYRHTASSGRFVWNIFNSRLNDPINFDMVINTDRVSDFEFLAGTLASVIKNIKSRQ